MRHEEGTPFEKGGRLGKKRWDHYRKGLAELVPKQMKQDSVPRVPNLMLPPKKMGTCPGELLGGTTGK